MRAGSISLSWPSGGKQQEHIDVGIREQLTAAETADGGQRQRIAEIGFLPQAAQRLVGQRRELAQHRVHAAGGGAREAQGVEKGELFGAIGFAQRRHIDLGCFDHGGGALRRVRFLSR
jgi:hypothetical protein